MRLSGHMEGLSIFNLIAGELAQVESLIERELSAGDEAVSRLASDFNRAGSKMIRPAMVLLSGANCGDITNQHIHTAAIIELIHNATLLHDDVIDEGTTRRGTATVNQLHGNETAVLLGDFLLSRVFTMCENLEPAIFKAIASATTQTCEGELMQLSQRQNWGLSESQYINIISKKTAALFRVCCYAGGLLAGASAVKVQSLSDYGMNVGIAFQIADDLLDVIGDERRMGKSAGNDIDKNKLTLPLIHLLSHANGKEKEDLKEKLSSSAKFSRTELTNMLKSYGSIEYTLKTSQNFASKAITNLASIDDNEAKKVLTETAKLAANRGA